MNKEYFDIRDNCRKGLLKYLLRALTIIPTIEKPLILDVGCGSGVPTIALAEKFNCNITAVDNDSKSINRLQEKVKELNLSDNISIVNSSLWDIEFEERQFDIIIAEGFLNVIGFERGFLKITKLLKTNGYFIIHDEYKNHITKIEFMESNGCTLLDSFRLDENVWWDDYYKCLEKDVSSHENIELFKSDLNEIEMYKKDSSQFNSIYYVIEKIKN